MTFKTGKVINETIKSLKESIMSLTNVEPALSAVSYIADKCADHINSTIKTTQEAFTAVKDTAKKFADNSLNISKNFSKKVIDSISNPISRRF